LSKDFKLNSKVVKKRLVVALGVFKDYIIAVVAVEGILK
jgi:hypothetical protein